MRSLKNNRGNVLYAVIIAIASVLLGLLMFIVLHPVYTTITKVAENSMNMSNATGYQALKNTWWLLPIAVAVGGLIYMYINSMRKEHIPYSY